MTSSSAQSGLGALAVQLRQRTAEAHSRLDSMPPMKKLLAQHLGRAEYGRALRSLYLAWAPIESELESGLQYYNNDPRAACLGSFFLARRHALANDLVTLGLPPASEPLSMPSSEVPLVPELAGQLYVLLGGQLGSVLIERSLREKAGSLPVTFFQARHSDLGGTWLSFRTALDTLFPTADVQEQVISAAERTFSCFTARISAADEHAT